MLHEDTTHFGGGASGDQIFQNNSMMELVEFTDISEETVGFSTKRFRETVLVFDGLEWLQVVDDDFF